MYIKIFFIICIISIYGCSNVGNMPHGEVASVSLRENNYKLIKVGAKGESSGFNLLGLIPIVSPTWANAKASLYKSIGVTLEGKAIGLANQTEDYSSIYLILFSLPTLTITADVVEFNSPASSASPISHASPALPDKE